MESNKPKEIKENIILNNNNNIVQIEDNKII